jgi:hypothetical protein
MATLRAWPIPQQGKRTIYFRRLLGFCCLVVIVHCGAAAAGATEVYFQALEGKPGRTVVTARAAMIL